MDKNFFSPEELNLLENLKILGGISPQNESTDGLIDIGCTHNYENQCSCGIKD